MSQSGWEWAEGGSREKRRCLPASLFAQWTRRSQASQRAASSAQQNTEASPSPQKSHSIFISLTLCVLSLSLSTYFCAFLPPPPPPPQMEIFFKWWCGGRENGLDSSGREEPEREHRRKYNLSTMSILLYNIIIICVKQHEQS
ncbi:hypothetical protein C4D60_Mb11t06140 [Musa balbisiana]|uniref:Uncharacterized protein n=1 Tax=Musa balbisiana TaxID=52838 RepID=A0A4S8J2Z8_MUSBA|nr:hypothetical protein C4D60_Mb11t06140 [Musa balbisiana]